VAEDPTSPAAVVALEGFVDRDEPIDLTNCDREPIHIPGAIQPHGIMLVLSFADLRVLQSSASVAEHLGHDPVAIAGGTLESVLGTEAAAQVRADIASGTSTVSSTVAVSRADGSGHRGFNSVVHCVGDRVVLELEPRVDGDEVAGDVVQRLVRETMAHVEQADTVKELAQRIAEQMRRLTGFDRVWVYRFHEDWHGEIIGEARVASVESWVGMHYPASDIPAQARALFLENWLRTIPDVGFVASPLVPPDRATGREPIDLGGSVLRSVSPIHIQYLQNMGVRASLVISLVHRGKLWGLISGHHYSGPRYVPYARRTLCQFLAQALSMQLGMAERVEDRDYELRIRDAERALVAQVGGADSPAAALTRGAVTIENLVECDGAAVVYDGDISAMGDRPSDAHISALVNWLPSRDTDVYSTSALGSVYPPAAAFVDHASGLLAAALGHGRNDYILWFRGEQSQTVSWAGDPRKPVTRSSDGSYRLHPRGSFDLWEEDVRGTSKPWLATEIDAVSDLRRAVLGLLLRRAEELAELNEELRQLNAQLEENAVELEVQTEELMQQQSERGVLLAREREARAEAEQANKAKSDFLAVMSHELRTPLNAIAGYAQLIEMGIRGPTTKEQNEDLARISDNQRHLLGLINSVLNFAKLESGQVQFAIKPTRLNELLRSLESMIRPQFAAKEIAYSLALCADDPRVDVDAEKLRQIMLNLLTNALKFTRSGGRVAVACMAEGATVSVRVDDTGRGIEPEDLASIFEPFVQVNRGVAASGGGVGLGLAISRDLARGMSGDLTATSTFGKGSTFLVTLKGSATT
jgi:chemotaxis family two-component system sensor kinase Cph1